MALLGAYSVPNGTAVRMSTLVPPTVRKIDVRANPNNSAVVYIGPADVATDGENAWIPLSAGDSWGIPEEGDTQLSPENVWLIATSTDKVHISYVT